MITKPIKAAASRLQEYKVAGWDGGMNLSSDELRLPPSFQRAAVNMYVPSTGGLQVRYGSAAFCDMREFAQRLIYLTYYMQFLHTVSIEGKIYAINQFGAFTEIWSDTIAKTRANAPNGWGPTDFVSTARFNNNLILCNGIDKPLRMTPDLSVDYLKDLSTGSNVNVPRARYATALGRRLILSGDPFAPSTIYVSAQDSEGTYENDPSSDGINIDLASSVRSGDPTILGTAAFRDKLLVFFRECILIGTFGEDSSNNFTVSFNDALELYGSVSHNSILTFGDDLLFCDGYGVGNIARAMFTAEIQPNRASQSIDAFLTPLLGRLSADAKGRQIMAVHNKFENQYWLVIPNASSRAETYDTTVAVLTLDRNRKLYAWSIFRGWNISAICRTSEDRIFFIQDNVLFRYGNAMEDAQRDFVGYAETYTDGTVHTDRTGFLTEGSDLTYATGLPVEFDGILPWTDAGSRLNSKTLQFLKVDSQGEGQYAVDVFADFYLQPPSDVGQEFSDGTIYTDGFGHVRSIPNYAPLLTMNMVGGNAQGYGGDPYGVIYGGGRIDRDERLYKLRGRCNVFKVRIHGEALSALQFTSLSVFYTVNSIQR